MKLKLLHHEVTIFSDSQSSIYFCINHVFHERYKHIDVKFNFVRDMIELRLIQNEKIPTEYNPLKMETKVLPLSKFRTYKMLLKIKIG